MLFDLAKTVVAATIETPVSVLADVVTLGGTLSDKDEPYTATALTNVMQNLANATKPDQD